MDPKTIPQLIEKLAHEFGTTAPELWSHLVRYAFWCNVSMALVGVVIVGIGLYLWRKSKAIMRSVSLSSDDIGNSRFCLAMALVLFSMGALLILLPLGGIISPEGDVIKWLVEKLGK